MVLILTHGETHLVHVDIIYYILLVLHCLNLNVASVTFLSIAFLLVSKMGMKISSKYYTHIHTFVVTMKSNYEERDLHTFYVKGQGVNVYSPVGHIASHEYSTLLLQHSSTHG